MEDFIHRGKTVKFWHVTGEVLASQKFNETHVSVSSSGGGGYIASGSGYVGAPHVQSSSSTITNHEFWIKTEDGREKDVKLKGVDSPLRAGQKISLISARRKESDSGWHSIVVNHSAGKHWYIFSAKELNKVLRLEVPTGKSLLIAAAIIFTVVYFTAPDSYEGKIWSEGSWALAIGTAGIFVIYRVVMKAIRTSRVVKRLGEHMKGLVGLACKNC